MSAPTAKKPYKRERKVKTVKPVAVLDIDELDKIVTAISMLIGKDKESAQTKINVNSNARKVLSELRNYRRRMTEYYQLAD